MSLLRTACTFPVIGGKTGNRRFANETGNIYIVMNVAPMKKFFYSEFFDGFTFFRWRSIQIELTKQMVLSLAAARVHPTMNPLNVRN